ncbi:MAG: tRNA (N(6)-L-threonylcarbamoyladenosine(37)-C(2))-methylthiotransferase MtaB [Anaerolineae bacterium]|nr:tRNA (N(6)-L-threonylcarbamoyladenosine(37)-C(2))-methylthiotransferase MtaB [Anaerolineae bacterium]
MSQRVYLHSLGCRLNRSETESFARHLAAAGQILVGDPAQADLCVVNTCAVTASAEKKGRRLLRSLRRANPVLRIAVVGCAATLHAGKLGQLPGVKWVIPNDEKERVVDILLYDLSPDTTFPLPAGGQDLGAFLHTRAFVKVQDGCDNRCAYCIVPLLRGPSRSRSSAEVVAEVRQRVAEGYREVVLTGVNLGAYGRERGIERGLAGLVEAILAQTRLPRLRLSSLEPWDLAERDLELWSDPRLCRQLHLPLQSGCDATLRRMGRRNDTGQYAQLAAAARAAIPGLALTTDLIVGFPGEDEADFAASQAFVAQIGFARLHVFPFSARPGTRAAQMDDQVPVPMRQERARRMRELGERLAARFRQQHVGQEIDVLWERGQNGRWRGWTDNYLPVTVALQADLHNRITRTRMVGTANNVLIGEISA